MIVRLEKEMFRVLTMNNRTITVNSQAVSKRRANKFAAALDCENKTVTPGDIVKVIDGLHKGQQGQVKYLYRHFAFLFTKSFPENAGYFVGTTRQLLLAASNNGAGRAALGGFGAAQTAIGQGFMSPRVLASPMHPSQQSGGAGAGGASSRHGSMSTAGGGSSSVNSSGGSSSVGKSPRTPLQNQQQQQQQKPGATRRNVALIGKTVRITQGPYKVFGDLETGFG